MRSTMLMEGRPTLAHVNLGEKYRKTFLELAANPKYSQSLYFKALYDHHILDITVTNTPSSPSFYNLQFFQTIKTAAEENSVEKWSSKQWYKHLLDRTVLCEELGPNDTSRENKKCLVETTFPDYNWETTWFRARMPGLSNDVRSMFWRFFHNLLPTQSRLHHLNRMAPEPTCVNCDTGETDHAWHHTFSVCLAMQPVRDWLVGKLNLLPIYYENIEKQCGCSSPL